jgi:hypothetical protein
MTEQQEEHGGGGCEFCGGRETPEPLMSLCGVCARRFCHDCAQLWHPKADLSYCPCWEVTVVRPPEIKSLSDFKQLLEFNHLKIFCYNIISKNKPNGKTSKKIRIRYRV